jgi:hypothetical protein
MNRSRLFVVLGNALLLIVIFAWVHSHTAQADSLGQLATGSGSNLMPGSTTVTAPSATGATASPAAGSAPTQCVANGNKLDPYSCSNPLGVFGPNQGGNGPNSPWKVNAPLNNGSGTSPAGSGQSAGRLGNSGGSTYAPPTNYAAPTDYSAPVNYGQTQGH